MTGLLFHLNNDIRTIVFDYFYRDVIQSILCCTSCLKSHLDSTASDEDCADCDESGCEYRYHKDCKTWEFEREDECG